MAVKIALAGNPNSGKTTLFNSLTGSNRFVGNWPGVTVEKKEGRLKGNKDVTITDLPGIYSLSPYTLEEVVARNYLINERPDVILNIVDGTNLERNLYLTTQLTELGIPVVMAVNMMDVVEKSGNELDFDALARATGTAVVPISALRGTGIMEASEKAVAAASDKCFKQIHQFDNKVEAVISKIASKLGSDIPKEQKRFYAIKLFERDDKISAKLPDVSAIIEKAEKDFDDDSESIITNARYEYITSIISGCFKKRAKQTLSTSDKIDRVVTNRRLALPIFAVIMFIVYYISVTTVGTFVTDWTNDGLFGDGFRLFGVWIPGVYAIVEAAFNTLGTAEWLNSLILDGIVGGVGAVLSFVPQMLVLFMFLAFLESCGYMARIAFIMDRIFRKFGLSGKSFIPMLIGTGCGVPGIMASRTIENDRDRKMTIMTTTFIPCGAKLPIIALIANALFGGAAWVAPSAYFAGIAAIVCSGIILKKTRIFSGNPAPFVMELPAYHWPTIENILRSMWERGWSFIKKAGTIILISSIIIWAGSRFGILENGSFGFGTELELENSILGMIGNAVKWIFIPLGFANTRAAIATIMGLAAKEEIVGVFGVLDFAELSKLAAYAFLLFNLLCAPCVAAIGAIRHEMNSAKWTWFAIGYQCVFAYVVSLCVYQIGGLYAGNGFSVWTAAAFLLAAGFVYILLKPYKESTALTLTAYAANK